MTQIIKRSKALSVSPLKSSQTLGAALAFLGFYRSMPMLHGSQGCTAFGKVFFVRHFREPIPLQTTAMDQIATVMGADDAVVEGLRTIAEKHKPALIGLPTTGLSETQGCDIRRVVQRFRSQYPEYESIPVVPVSTPDFSGCLETGFAKALEEIIHVCVKPAAQAGTQPGRRAKQVNLLVGSALGVGDIDEVKQIVEAFGLRPVVLPDLSDALDGHLPSQDFSPLTIGGLPVSELETLGDSIATLVIGAAQYKAADALLQLTRVPDHRFEHLMSLGAIDAFVQCLQQISGQPVPERIERQRARLQDAMLDCHFMLGMARAALAGDPEVLVGYSQLLAENGASAVAVVSPVNSPALQGVVAAQVQIGDLEDLEHAALAQSAEFIIGNSHAAHLAEHLGIPIYRAGFPQYDWVGGYQRCAVGYAGVRQTLFDLANLMLSLEKGEIKPYRSIYAQKNDLLKEPIHETATQTSVGELCH